jgi:hypothetical protein
MMPHGRSAPLVTAALTGAVHDRQGADGHQRNCGEDNCQRGVHRDLVLCGPGRGVAFAFYGILALLVALLR